MLVGGIEIYNEEIQKVLIAALLGAILGFERESKGKPAGLRTLALVSAGSALFTVISYHMAAWGDHIASDPTRIASNIVTGVGFIGAGIIFRGSNNVHGLTTAAAVWISAAIGMSVGAGEYSLAIVSTVIVWAVLVVLYRFEMYLVRISRSFTYKVCFHDTGGEGDNYSHYFQVKGYKLDTVKYSKQEGRVTVEWTVTASQKKHDEAIQKLLSDKNVVDFSYS